MGWQDDLRNTAQDPGVAERVIAAVDEVLARDAYLFEYRVNERAISHRFAIYLEALFPGWNVDCEYDRDGRARKEIPRGSGNDDDEGSMVLPDIIIHKRGADGRNLLVVEIKKSSNTESDDWDFEKLRAYVTHYGYEHAVFLRFIVGRPQPEVSRAEFVHPLGRAELA